MNYPIFNLDYQYTLEELVRYVRFFPEHRATIVVSSKEPGKCKFYTYHQYRKDGLLIRLSWESKYVELETQEITIDTLFKLKGDKGLRLLSYNIISFSYNADSRQPLSNDEVKEKYFNHVLQGKTKKKYQQKEYKQLEYDIKQGCTIPDLFFEFMIEEIQKSINFENYYKKLKS
ncbi:hypothetical protein U8V72_18260 [Priestia filamentosa]|uniref:hypothetical protein n=1 Tax=Priestia filamentosa TaxID=1402861 RepID=UPI0005895545